jgi:hypothetical protein
MTSVDLQELQRSLATVDLSTEPRPTGRVEIFKVLVLRLQHLKVKMYQEMGHKTPHLHVDYGTERHMASYAIEDGARLAGELDSKYDRTIAAWIAERRAQLLDTWNALQQGEDASVLIGELRGDA